MWEAGAGAGVGGSASWGQRVSWGRRKVLERTLVTAARPRECGRRAEWCPWTRLRRPLRVTCIVCRVTSVPELRRPVLGPQSHTGQGGGHGLLIPQF